MPSFKTVKELKEFLSSEEGSKLEITLEDGFGENPYSKDGVNSYLETEEGKQLLQPKLDTYHAKSLKSWQEKNIDKIKKDYHDEMSKESLDKIAQLEKQNSDLALDSKMTAKLLEDGFNAKYMKYVKSEFNSELLKVDGDNLLGYTDQVSGIKERFPEWLSDSKPSSVGKQGTPKDDIIGNDNNNELSEVEAQVRYGAGLPIK